ncbi:hypothetical protein FRX31_034513 [Thalictrum thalictroides]|uniref:Acidic protein n=1 Tax=Thalictrum thalictroides TaxID=46969 RepID=A0A7J6UTI8_THATH|nr:hypothetical protein FRX31_034513 [Thalictrum thalictroides]
MMEGKGSVRAVIMGLFILGLVVAQIEARTCCMTTIGRSCHGYCVGGGASPRPVCARECDCIIVTGSCPRSHPHSSMLENSVDVIEEVTAGAKVYPTFVVCPSPDSRACFTKCRMTQRACADKCGCQIVYPPRDI